MVTIASETAVLTTNPAFWRAQEPTSAPPRLTPPAPFWAHSLGTDRGTSPCFWTEVPGAGSTTVTLPTMAKKVETIVTLVDDLDGGKAERTITFGFDGATYEIDLSKRNAAAFEKVLGPYLAKYRVAQHQRVLRAVTDPTGGTARRQGTRTAFASAKRRFGLIRIGPPTTSWSAWRSSS